MTEHIVALFEAETAAAAAERDLEGAGIPGSAMRRYRPTETEKPEPETSGAGATSHSSGGGFWAWLWGEDADTETTRSAYSNERDGYDRRVRAGNTVLSVRLDDDSMIHTAVSILDAHHPLEIDERADETEPTATTAGSFVPPETAGRTNLSSSGVDYSTSAVATPGSDKAGFASAASATTESSAAMPGTDRVTPATEEEVIPLAEEQLEVGKRTVDRGTTRVRRYVVERPAEQDVTLHGQRVTVERRRPVEGTTAGGGAFEERTVEVRETEEVPVVGKTARVVEEVAIRKEATERTETVKDTVRREEVEVSGDDDRLQSPRP